MDGNGRWASERNLPRIAGHRAGVDAVRAVVEECARLGIGYLTLFAFSTENWKRPREEVGALMTLLDQYLKKELETLMENNIRLKSIGRISDIPAKSQQTLNEVCRHSSGNTGLTLILALSYSGRDDILQAAREWGKAVQRGEAEPDSLQAEDFSSFLSTADVPDPDLLIRTSGEMRISNFLLWQVAYTEFYVTPRLWPDFNADDLRSAIKVYQSRERRFGLTSEQLRSGER
ncbi:MAG: isoprenyl transferase [bacterium]|nr:MAG: isoprenyl transferase [bacterium]